MILIYVTFRLKVGTNDIVKVVNFLKSISFKKSEKIETFEEINEEITNDNYTDNEINNEEITEKLEESFVHEKPVNDIEEKIINDVGIEVEDIIEEKSESDNLADKLVDDFGQFDPKLELSKFEFPKLNLLKQYDSEKIKIDKQELEENKNKIVETLANYNISISNIKATIGPTVTLYEIIPDAGVRISKIKNLEDDIALSLAALGIRIIAPIPGKGTIGIEVPNRKPSIVSMRSVISSSKFQNAEMELPVAIGKTISNETFVVDLAKMPHLLMAGATGQGKSVGLNAVLTSLLYKKHPAEIKFVLVDPKKVELNIYSKIERHYLAKLPDTEDSPWTRWRGRGRRARLGPCSRAVHSVRGRCVAAAGRPSPRRCLASPPPPPHPRPPRHALPRPFPSSPSAGTIAPPMGADVGLGPSLCGLRRQRSCC